MKCIVRNHAESIPFSTYRFGISFYSAPQILHPSIVIFLLDIFVQLLL